MKFIDVDANEVSLFFVWIRRISDQGMQVALFPFTLDVPDVTEELFGPLVVVYHLSDLLCHLLFEMSGS